MAEGDDVVAARVRHRLGVVPLVGAGGRVAHVADRGAAGEAAQRGLVEDAAHQAQVALHRDVAGVADGDARALLAAVLQRVEGVEGQPRDVAPRRDHREDPALLLGMVVDHSGAPRRQRSRRRLAPLMPAPPAGRPRVPRGPRPGQARLAVADPRGDVLAAHRADRRQPHRRAPGQRAQAPLVLGPDGQQHPAAALAEQDLVVAPPRRQRHLGAQAARDRRLGQRHGQPAAGHVVRAAQDPLLGRRQHQLDRRHLAFHVHVGRPAERAADGLARVQDAVVAGQHHQVALGDEPLSHARVRPLEQAHHPHHRSRVDRAARGLIVEGHVAGHDGHRQGRQGLAHARDGLGQPPAGRALLGVGEVQAVRRRDRARADAGQVAGGLEHRRPPAAARVELAVALGAVGGERDRALAARQAHHGRVAARAADRVGAHQVVVALVDPALRGQVGPRQQVAPGGGQVGRLRHRGQVERLGGRRRVARDLVDRRLVGQQPGGQVGHDLAAGARDQGLALGDRPDPGGVEVPAPADRDDLVEARGLDDGQHPLLALRDQDLGRGQRLPQRHEVEVDVQAHPPLRGHLAGGAREPRGAEVLERDQRPRPGQLEAAVHELALGERVAHLHRGALVLVLVQLGRRQHARAADAVAAGAVADQHQRVARPRRRRPQQALGRHHARRTSR